jgi:hypothetical protein
MSLRALVCARGAAVSVPADGGPPRPLSLLLVFNLKNPNQMNWWRVLARHHDQRMLRNLRRASGVRKNEILHRIGQLKLVCSCKRRGRF